MAKTKAKITQEIFNQIEEVRLSGACNMLDLGCVVGELQALGHTQAMVWLSNNPNTYFKRCFTGYEIAEIADTDGNEEPGVTVTEHRVTVGDLMDGNMPAPEEGERRSYPSLDDALEDHFTEDEHHKRESGFYDDDE